MIWLIQLWLRACSRSYPRIVGAARGVHLPLGRQLVLAGLQALSPAPQPACEAIMPVSLAVVGPVFGRVTFGWVHDAWKECGLLSGELGQWMLSMMDSAEETVLHAVRTTDAGLPELAAAPSSADGSDFLSTAASCVAGGKPIASAAMVDAQVFSPCLAVGGASVSSRSTRSDGGFADIGVHSKDVVCPLCRLCDDDLRDGPDSTSLGTCGLWSSVRAAKAGFMLHVHRRCRPCAAAAWGPTIWPLSSGLWRG